MIAFLAYHLNEIILRICLILCDYQNLDQKHGVILNIMSNKINTSYVQ